MYWIILWLLVLLLSVVRVFGQADAVRGDASKAAEAVRSEVLHLEEQGRLRSLRGETNWDDMMADGAYLISPDGAVYLFTKGKSLPSLPLKDFKITELRARVYGKSVVVTGLAHLEAETRDKGTISIQMRYLNVWRRVGDSWKMVVSQRTIVKSDARRSEPGQSN